MIDLYFTTSPNVYKICIALEEIGADYSLLPVNLRRGDQFDPPRIGGGVTGKVPVVVDHGAEGGPHTVFESGAILQYLADKSGRLLPKDAAGRSKAMQWLFWQVGGLGPFSGQCFHFRVLAPILAPDVNNSYSRGRNEKIMAAHWQVMETCLAQQPYLAGEYSIADIACYPWIRYLCPDEGREAYPGVAAWYDRLSARPAIVRAYERARGVDMGAPRNELDTVMHPPETLRSVIVV